MAALRGYRVSKVRRIRGVGLRDVAKRVHGLGAVAAQSVASQAAPLLTTQARSDFDAGRTVYGTVRPSGVRGPVTLVRTGATRSTLGFSAQGTRMRVVLSTRWAKYLVGRFRILPIGDRSAIPPAWKKAIDGAVSRVLSAEWRKAA